MKSLKYDGDRVTMRCQVRILNDNKFSVWWFWLKRSDITNVNKDELKIWCKTFCQKIKMCTNFLSKKL